MLIKEANTLEAWNEEKSDHHPACELAIKIISQRKALKLMHKNRVSNKSHYSIFCVFSSYLSSQCVWEKEQADVAMCHCRKYLCFAHKLIE